MKSTITNAADISILKTKTDRTLKTGGGPASVGAIACIMSKGPVGKVFQVTNDTASSNYWLTKCGKPLPKKTAGMEGLRHLADAVKECNYVNAVRVAADDARFPVLAVHIDTGVISTVAIGAAGAGYSVNDVLTIVQAGAAAGTAKVLTIGASGEVTSIELVTGGTGYSVANGLATTVAPAGGTDCTLNITAITNATSVVETAVAYGTTPALGAGDVLKVWPSDGDPSTNRSFEIADVITDRGAYSTEESYAVDDIVSVAGGRLICVSAHIATDTDPTLASPGTKWKVYDGQFDGRFTINFYDKDSEGTEYLLESYVVGVGDSDKDDMGLPAFIETVLENNDSSFRALWDDTKTLANVSADLKDAGKTSYLLGTNGSDPATADWTAAWDLFRNESVLAHLMFIAPIADIEGTVTYADVLANCFDIAKNRRSSFFWDVSPALSDTAAIAYVKSLGQDEAQANIYYSPFSANDPYYGGKTVWGASGDAVAACARGDKNFTGSTPGVHYAPAGSTRAKLTRTGITPLYPTQVINRDDFYNARINPVVADPNGGAVIDDCLAMHYKQDYSRFTWVNRIDNAIAHRMYEMAAQLKFEPDGLTRSGLNRGGKAILDEFVTSGALVPPRDPAADGTNPYILTVVQQEIDLWLVTWEICPTGAARRIAGQPILIK